MVNYLKKIYNYFFPKKEYVITTMKAGVKYYYLGGINWTPVNYGAKVFDYKPDFNWINETHEIEKI